MLKVLCRYTLLGLVLLAGCRSALAPPAGPARPLPEKPPVESSLPAIAFTIQVGAFSTTERAARYADRLAAYGLDTYYFIDRDGLCKVRFDRFDTKDLARERALELQARGVIDAFYIVRPGRSFSGGGHRSRLQEDLVHTARRFIGTPYRWGGLQPATASIAAG